MEVMSLVALLGSDLLMLPVQVENSRQWGSLQKKVRTKKLKVMKHFKPNHRMVLCFFTVCAELHWLFYSHIQSSQMCCWYFNFNPKRDCISQKEITENNKWQWQFSIFQWLLPHMIMITTSWIIKVFLLSSLSSLSKRLGYRICWMWILLQTWLCHISFIIFYFHVK